MSHIRLRMIKQGKKLAPPPRCVRCPECGGTISVAHDAKETICEACEAVYEVHREPTLAERAEKGYDAAPPLEMAKEQLRLGKHSE